MGTREGSPPGRSQPPEPIPRPSSASPFAQVVAEHLEEAFRLDPLSATAAGIHDHDDRWPDLSDAGRMVRLEWIAGWTARLGALDPATLSPDDAIDRDRILAVLATERYTLAEGRDDAWDPLAWIYLLGDGLVGLLAREFAPVPDRLLSLAGRLEGIPEVVEAARAILGSVAELPVSRFHTERALLDLPGMPALIDEAIELAEGHADDLAMAEVRPRLDAAEATARAAIDAYGAHLRDVVLPGSEGEGRLEDAADEGTEVIGHRLVRPEQRPQAGGEAGHLAANGRELGLGRGEDVLNRHRRVAEGWGSFAA